MNYKVTVENTQHNRIHNTIGNRQNNIIAKIIYCKVIGKNCR